MGFDYYSDPKPTERKQTIENVAQKNEKSISGAIKVNEKEVMEYLDGLVWESDFIRKFHFKSLWL